MQTRLLTRAMSTPALVAAVLMTTTAALAPPAAAGSTHSSAPASTSTSTNPGKQFVADAVGLFGLVPDGSQVVEWSDTGSTPSWTPIGGPASAIAAGS